MKKRIKRIVAFLIVLGMQIPTICLAADNQNSIVYTDVPSTHWAFEAIDDMTSRGLFNGTASEGDGTATFSPDAEMTRAQFIAVLTRFLYAQALSEMEPGTTWYTNNYLLALEYGLLTSDEFDEGLLTVPCTRQEMAMLLVRTVFQSNGETAEWLLPTSSIPDFDSVQEYYQQYVLQAYSMGLLTGIDSEGTFQPEGHLSRAQAALVIYRVVDPSVRSEITPSGIGTYTWRDGISYSGQIRDGEANGYGRMVFPEIGTYVGYFVNGRREGQGSFQWDVGDVYEGAWNNDKMTGFGTYTFADGYVINGHWQDNRISADSLSMTPSSLVLTVGQIEHIVARIEPSQITEVIEWTNSDDNILTIQSQGNLCTITAKSIGKATITAKTASGKMTSCEVTVNRAEKHLRQIQLNYGDYKAEIGDNVQLKAELTPTDATDGTVTWSSSNPSVASVSKTGLVTALARGAAIISAKTENGLIATCHFMVENMQDELWNATWSIYSSTAAGNKSGSTSIGSCVINLNQMTASLTMYPYTGKFIDLNPVSNYEMAGLFETSSSAYELTFTSIRDHLIILEVKQIFDDQYYSDSVVVSYFALE